MAQLLATVLALDAPIPLVIDAAALAAAPAADKAFKTWSGGAVMLPHIGEMAALLECEAPKSTRIARARRGALRNAMPR